MTEEVIKIRSQHSCEGHIGRVNTCKFLEKQGVDAGYFVSGGADGIVRLWNFAKTQQPLLLHSFKGGHHNGDILDVSCSSGGLRVASAGLDKAISIWDITSGSLWGRLHGHENRVNCCHFRDAVILSSGSSDGTLRLWDARAKNSIQTLPRFRDSISGTYIDEHTVVGCSVDGSIRNIRCQVVFSISRDGKCYLVSLVHQPAAMYLLERSSGKKLRSFTGHKNETVSISSCFDHQDQHVGSGSEDGIVRFWNLVSGKIEFEENMGTMVLSISHHPSRSAFVIGGADGLLKCFSW